MRRAAHSCAYGSRPKVRGAAKILFWKRWLLSVNASLWLALSSLIEHPRMTKKQEKSFSQTIRQQIASLLVEKAMTAREISQATGIRQKEVYDHLSHVARSATGQRKRLRVLPFRCLSCGFVFEERRRFTPASRCPRCKKTHLEFPTYRLS
jgi:predicted Zn-ribbon and HTH transcriptional regulator